MQELREISGFQRGGDVAGEHSVIFYGELNALKYPQMTGTAAGHCGPPDLPRRQHLILRHA